MSPDLRCRGYDTGCGVQFTALSLRPLIGGCSHSVEDEGPVTLHGPRYSRGLSERWVKSHRVPTARWPARYKAAVTRLVTRRQPSLSLSLYLAKRSWDPSRISLVLSQSVFRPLPPQLPVPTVLLHHQPRISPRSNPLSFPVAPVPVVAERDTGVTFNVDTDPLVSLLPSLEHLDHFE